MKKRVLMFALMAAFVLSCGASAWATTASTYYFSLLNVQTSGNVYEATEGGTITVSDQDVPNSNRYFGFYQLITNQAPIDATGITVRFEVTTSGEQSLDLDDVSLTVA